MISCFPLQNGTNAAVLMAGYAEAAAGCSDQAIAETASGFTTGKIEAVDGERINRSFAPTPAQFGFAARERHQHIEAVKIAKRSMALPAPTYRASSSSPFMTKIAAKRRRMQDEGRELLRTGVTADQFAAMARSRETPERSVWIASGEVWGPVRRAMQEAAE